MVQITSVTTQQIQQFSKWEYDRVHNIKSATISFTLGNDYSVAGKLPAIVRHRNRAAQNRDLRVTYHKEDIKEGTGAADVVVSLTVGPWQMILH